MNVPLTPTDVEKLNEIAFRQKQSWVGLTQPEQEPVLWMMPDGNTVDKWALQFYGGQKGKPLYTAPPQRTWVGLTDEEVQEIMEKTVASCTELDDITGDTARFTWRNIEAKLREKNQS